MKLLAKLNIRYILYSLAVMAVSGIAIYFILSLILNRELDEQLSGILQSVESQIGESQSVMFNEPFTQVRIIEQKPETTTFSDTLIYNVQEKEFEEYRQIRAVKDIKGRYYGINIQKSKIEWEDLLGTLAMVTVAAMLLLTTILILLNRWVAKSVWLPFYRNLNSIGNFSLREKKPVLLEETGITEFDKLNSVLTELTGQIISDYENQKQFSEDVSHELQTPLAIISSHLEALLDDPGISKQHAKELNSINSTVRRFSKLNKELILISKIENNQFVSVESTNLKDLIIGKLDEFSELIRLKKLNSETAVDDDFIISINPALAVILVNNLLSNAINHNTEGGKIRIEINSGRLSICNSGTSEIAHPETIFNRFSKADPSSNSVGLGLAIAKKICDYYSLSIRYSFSDSMHIFTLSATS